MAHILFQSFIHVRVSASMFCYGCLHAYMRGPFNVYVIDYIRTAVSCEQFRDTGAMNSASNLKHQGQVIIKIYDAAE